MTLIKGFSLRIGNACPNRALNIRLMAGAWCLSAAVLVPAYSSILISHITLSLKKPLINSVYDIINVPGLKIATDRGKGIDLMFKQFVGSLQLTFRPLECANNIFSNRPA